MKNLTVDMIPELLKMIEVKVLLEPEQEVTLRKFFHCEWPSPISVCPYCYSADCANLKNSAAMCPGPAP